MAMPCETPGYLNNELPEFQVANTAAQSIIEPRYTWVGWFGRLVWSQSNFGAAPIKQNRAFLEIAHVYDR